jgi:hypothetical protein
MSSLHIDPLDPHLHFISDPEGLLGPLTHETVSLLVIMVVIVVEVC